MESYSKKITEMIEAYSEYISNCYEYYMDCFEIFLNYMGHNGGLYNKINDVNIDKFNFFMSGYQKAMNDMGINPDKTNKDTKEDDNDPSSIYF